MRLIARGSPRPALGHRYDEFGRAQFGDCLGELRRGHASREADHLGARGIRVDDHAGEGNAVEGHGVGCDREVDAVGGDKRVEDVEILDSTGIHLDDPARLDDERRLRIAR